MTQLWNNFKFPQNVTPEVREAYRMRYEARDRFPISPMNNDQLVNFQSLKHFPVQYSDKQLEHLSDEERVENGFLSRFNSMLVSRNGIFGLALLGSD